MDAQEGKGEGHTGAAKSMTTGLSLEVERSHIDVTEASEVSTAVGTCDGVRGTSALSANGGGTPFFSPSCFRTPARSLASAEAVTAYKTARSHLDTADCLSVGSRSGMLTAFRAPCFNGASDSPIHPLAPLDVSPIPVHAPGEIPAEEDADRPVKQVSFALEEGSPRQPDDSRETEMCTLPAGDAREEEFQENCCMNLDDGKARRNKRKVRSDCSDENKSIVLVDAPVLEGKSFHGIPWGDSRFHCSHSSPDHDQYDSSLVPSRLYDDGVTSAPWWLNGSGSTEDTYLDVMTPPGLTTSGELTALDKLNRLLIAFNRRATGRVWIMDSPSHMRLLKCRQDTQLSPR